MESDGLRRRSALPRCIRVTEHLHVVTLVTGIGTTIAAAVLPVGKLADYSNSGTLFAFFMVAIAVMVLRKKDPDRKRPFRAPGVFIVAPLAIIGCLVLYFSLPSATTPAAAAHLGRDRASGLFLYSRLRKPCRGRSCSMEMGAKSGMLG